MNEVRRASRHGSGRDHDRFVLRALGFVFRREPDIDHPIEHAIATSLEPRGALSRIVERRATRHARDAGGFGEREIFRGLVEEVLARGLGTFDVRTEVDAVQIRLENRVLVERSFDAEGDGHHVDLPRERARRADQPARELLRERRSAGDDVAVRDRLPERPRERERIDARMRIEAVIFCGEHGADERRPELGQRRSFDAFLSRATKLGDELSVPILDADAVLGPNVRGGLFEELLRDVGAHRERDEHDPRHQQRRDHDAHGEEEAPRPRSAAAPLSFQGFTSIVTLPVRPNTSGTYISSAFVGGTTNEPIDVARAR